MAKEFLDVFPEKLPGLPPKKEIEFYVDLALNTQPISIRSYHMMLAKLKELKGQL